jgi:hypothetical protein
MAKANVDEFEAFIDEGIRQSENRGYHPTVFTRMRQQYGTIPAIERLVKAGEIQSGFLKLQKLNMLEWSIEAAVQKFPDKFTQEARDCADFRLKNINDKALRTR